MQGVALWLSQGSCFLVIEDDEPYSVARIAMWCRKEISVAEGEEQSARVVRCLQRRGIRCKAS